MALIPSDCAPCRSDKKGSSLDATTGSARVKGAPKVREPVRRTVQSDQIAFDQICGDPLPFPLGYISRSEREAQHIEQRSSVSV